MVRNRKKSDFKTGWLFIEINRKKVYYIKHPLLVAE